MNVRLFNKQILHSKHTNFPNKELGGSNGSQGKPLTIKSFMREGNLVSSRLGDYTVDAIYLAFAGHFYK